MRDRLKRSNIFNSKSQDRIQAMRQLGERKATLNHQLHNLTHNEQSLLLDTSLEETREKINKLIKDKEHTMNEYKRGLNSKDPLGLEGTQDDSRFYGKAQQYI